MTIWGPIDRRVGQQRLPPMPGSSYQTSLPLGPAYSRLQNIVNHSVPGAVRTPPLMIGQTPEVQRQIRAAFDRLAQEYVKGGSLEIPASLKLTSGTKPR